MHIVKIHKEDEETIQSLYLKLSKYFAATSRRREPPRLDFSISECTFLISLLNNLRNSNSD